MKRFPANARFQPVCTQNDCPKGHRRSVQPRYFVPGRAQRTFIAHKASNLANAPAVSEKYRILSLDTSYDSRQVDEVREALGLPEHERLFRLVRIAVNETDPLRIEEIYVAADEVSDEQVGRLDSFLNLPRYRERGIVHSSLVPELIPGKYSRLLRIGRDTPVIRKDEQICKKNGKPYLFVRIYYNPETTKIDLNSI